MNTQWTKSLRSQTTACYAAVRALPAQPLVHTVLFIAVFYFIGFGLLGFLLSPYDYNHLSTYYDLAWRFWRESPGLPHFNPYFCGGRTLGGDPQVPIFHPLTFLVPALGAELLLKWEMLTQLLVGSVGLWKWLERWSVSKEGRVWALLLFIGGGAVVARFLVGHVTLGFYFLTPCYFLLSYRLCDPSLRAKHTRYAFWLAVLFIYCGLYKPNFFLYALPPLVFEAALRSVLSRSTRPLGVLVGATVVSGLACAVSLLPSQAYFNAFPRTQDAGPKAVPLYSLLANLLLPLKAIPASWYGAPFMQRHEYNVFVGPVALWFTYLGLKSWKSLSIEARSLAGFAVFCAWLGLGAETASFEPLKAYSWFGSVWPGFQSTRVPVRFWTGFSLAVIVFSAMGFRWPTKNAWQVGLVVFGAMPLMGNALINLSKPVVFATQPQWFPAAQYPTDIQQVHGQPDYPYDSIRQGVGVIECVENVEAGRSPLLRAGDLLAPRSDRPVSWKAHWSRWNQVTFSGHSAVAQNIRLNFNSHPQWAVHSDQTKIASGLGDTMTLQVAAGSFSGVLTYTQPRVAAGLLISLLTLFCLGFFYYRFCRRGGPLRIGLTGGIGSGKTAVGEILKERGWWVVDLDAEGKRLLNEDAELRAKVEKALGTIDRTKLRTLVFEDASKRATLESLLHPALMQAYEAKVKAAAKAGVPAVVCEAALLVETGLYKRFDQLIVVTAPLEQRRARVLKREGMSPQLFDSIIAAQSDDETKLKIATFHAKNPSSLADLKRCLATFCRKGACRKGA